MLSDDQLRDQFDHGKGMRPPKPPIPSKSVKPLELPATYTEKHLASLNIPPAVFIVDELLPAGAALFSAPPKIGKTWINMTLGRAVVTGEPFCGCRKVSQGPVLLLDLEGNQRRAQKRTAIVRDGAEPSELLQIAHEWPPMSQGGLELLEAKITQDKLCLVVVDIWGMFRPSRPKNVDPYDHDHRSAQLVSAMAIRNNCAIVLTHHNRKAEAIDWIDGASGSTGLTAGVDTIWSLSRKRGEADAVLKVTGREIEDAVELAMSFKGGRWSILGEAIEVLMHKTRQTIHSALHFAGNPMRPAEVAERLGLKRNTVAQTLRRMLQDGTVVADASGAYSSPNR